MDPRYHIYIGPIGWCSDHYWCDGWPVETYQTEVHDWYIDILIDKLVNWYIDIWYTDILSIIYIGPIRRCSDGWPVETYQTEVHDWWSGEEHVKGTARGETLEKHQKKLWKHCLYLTKILLLKMSNCNSCDLKWYLWMSHQGDPNIQ